MIAQASRRCDGCSDYHWNPVEHGYCERLRKALLRLGLKPGDPAFSVRRYQVRANDCCSRFRKALPLSAGGSDD